MEPSLQIRIRDRAYQIWNASGRLEGQADHHWLEAEREVLAEMTERASGPEPAQRKSPRRPRETAKAGAFRKAKAKAG